MRFADEEIRLIANRSGLNEKAVNRLLGSARVTLLATDELQPQTTFFELGLLLQRLDPSVGAARETRIAAVSTALTEYRQRCPLVAAWLGRGDFKVNQVPADLTRPTLLHACRTASRLRAQLLRNLRPTFS